MASSVVYSGIFGAVLATLRAVSTRMVVFDTSVVDLTEDLQDSVDLLFGTQLGGGTDINLALTYCQQIITRPTQTILVLITDLYEGGSREGMLRRAAGTGRQWCPDGMFARSQRPRGTRLQSAQCSRASRNGNSGICLHTRPVSRFGGGGNSASGFGNVGCEERYCDGMRGRISSSPNRKNFRRRFGHTGHT